MSALSDALDHFALLVARAGATAEGIAALKIVEEFCAASVKAKPVPAFHGFMDESENRVGLCFTPNHPRHDGVYATAYYTAPPAPHVERDAALKLRERISHTVGYNMALNGLEAAYGGFYLRRSDVYALLDAMAAQQEPKS